MMAQHNNRSHALLSASGAHRWMRCTASALLEQQFPDTTSNSAKEGTLAHELAEMKVRSRLLNPTREQQAAMKDKVQELKSHELWNDEMQYYTDIYVECIEDIALQFVHRPYITVENRVDFSKWVPDGFGTADCIMIGDEILQIVDFKYGKSPKGKVEAKYNYQMMLYALGAYQTYQYFYPIKKIRLCIVQPRLSEIPSTWECCLDDLLDFGAYASEKAKEALSGNGSFNPDEKACRFCRAGAVCRARAQQIERLAANTGSVKPPLIAPEEIKKYIEMADEVSNWLNALKEYALAQCLAGKSIPGLKAVNGRSSRSFNDLDAAFETLRLNGVDEAMLYEKKPITLAQVEKMLGKPVFQSLLKDYITVNPGKPTLVAESDKRAAITNQISAAQAFQNK